MALSGEVTQLSETSRQKTDIVISCIHNMILTESDLLVRCSIDTFEHANCFKSL